MERRYLRGFVLRDSEDQAAEDAPEEGGPLRIIAATAGRKADGLNITMDGADLGRFEANPVVGYGHNYWGRDGLPIGRADKTWIDGDRLLMDVTFDPDDAFAQQVERKYRGGFLNAFSIGFDVWNIDDDGTPEGWELFEVSAVPLPMDPNAVVESGRSLDAALRSGTVLAPDPFASLAGLLDVRAGAVLSKANKTLVSNAVKALNALLDAAGGADDDPEDEARAAQRAMDERRRRLRL